MSEYLPLIEQSFSVAFADFVRSREIEGHEIIKMQTGDPDFPTHEHVVQAANEALLKGETNYCSSMGLLSLRKAVAEKLRKENNIHVSPDENILITHGAVHGISMAIRAVLNTGDECIILEPFWRAYEANVILAGGIPVIVKTRKENDFGLVAKDIIDKVTNKTRLIIINTPNNPSGAIYEYDELYKLATFAKSKGIYILSDEVYESIVFDDKTHYSIASDPVVRDNIISVFSFSKTHAMTGWRIGYLAASSNLIKEMLKLSQFSITSLSPFAQAGALAALKSPEAQQYINTMKLVYQERRNFIIEKIAGTWLEAASTIPNGAFYLLIDFSRFNLDSLTLAKKLVEFSNIAFTPGIAFGDGMDSYLRLCFATSIDNIERAINELISMDIYSLKSNELSSK